MDEMSLFEYAAEKEEFGEVEKEKVFKGLNLEGVNFSGKNFYRCRFEDCKLKEVELKKVTFEKCEFLRCNLSMMKPTRSSFIDVSFKESKVIGVNWQSAATPIGINFDNCLISYSNFFGLNLTMIKILNSTSREADFAEANLSKSKLNGTNFKDSLFLRTNLTGANFEFASNYSIDPNNNKIAKAIFSLPEAVSLLAFFDITLK